MKQFTAIITFFLIFGNCNSLQNNDNFEENYYQNEKAAVDFYLRDRKKRSLKNLSKRCKNKKNALSCYNLAVLYNQSGDFKKSLQEAEVWGTSALMRSTWQGFSSVMCQR